MTVTLTYDSTLARIRITADALAAADYATVERSVDGGVRWTTVRGGVQVPVTAGSMAALDDYEFRPGVANQYRVRGVESGAITYVGSGGDVAANNASLSPGLPGSLVAGDAMVLFASIRNSGTGTANTPTGWTPIVTFGNCALFGRRYVAGDGSPTVTFAGGAAGATTLAGIAAWRRADTAAATSTSQLNGSAQNIAYPALTIPVAGAVVVLAGWKQDVWTSVATALGTEISEPASALGSGASQGWDYQIQTTATNVAAGSMVVTGGSSAISRSAVIALPHAPWLNSQTASTTPTLTAVWLKSVIRAFLNRAVKVSGPPLTPTRAGRGEANDVAGRSLPIAYTDVAGARAYHLQVRTATASDAQVMDYVIASGDILFLQASSGKGVPAGGVYLLVGDTNEVRQHVAGDLVHWSIPVQEVAPPGPDVVVATVTHDTLLARYATFDDLLAANPTFDDLMALMGDPSEVIVP